MNVVGLNQVVKSDAMRDAFKKAGYCLRKSTVKWPSTKGPVGLRIDMRTGYLVAVVK